MMAKNILKKLLLIQQELKVPKNQFNSFGKYNYRSCEDILESARPIANKNNCVIVINDDIKEINGRYYVEATITLFDVESGEEISTKALAREAEPKSGMSESQLTGACSSYARKYALSAMFALDDEKDDDTRDNRQQSKQITLCELDNILMSYGVPSIFDEIDADSLIETESVSYYDYDFDNTDQNINIIFDVIKYVEDSPIDTVIKVKNVEEV